jgi:hypothetical protein
MLQYAHHSATDLKLPSRDGIRRRVTKLGEETVEGTREMFKVGMYLSSLAAIQHTTVDFGGKDQSFTRRMDIKQWLRIFGYCCSLCHQRRSIRHVFPLIMCNIY